MYSIWALTLTIVSMNKNFCFTSVETERSLPILITSKLKVNQRFLLFVFGNGLTTF